MSDVRLTPIQAAKRLGISKDAVYKLCRARVEIIDGREVTFPPELGHFRFGEKIVIPEDEIKAYEAKCFVQAGPVRHPEHV